MTVMTFSLADHNWTVRALCAKDDDLWYPSPKSNSADVQEQIEAAKGVCQVCPVIAQCKADIEATEGNCGLDKRHGIRAAMTPRERYNAHRRAGMGQAA